MTDTCLSIEYEIWTKQKGIYVKPEKKQISINLEDVKNLIKVVLEEIKKDSEHEYFGS